MGLLFNGTALGLFLVTVQVVAPLKSGPASSAHKVLMILEVLLQNGSTHALNLALGALEILF